VSLDQIHFKNPFPAAKSIVDFIETAYVHPMLEEDSLVVHSVQNNNAST